MMTEQQLLDAAFLHDQLPVIIDSSGDHWELQRALDDNEIVYKHPGLLLDLKRIEETYGIAWNETIDHRLNQTWLVQRNGISEFDPEVEDQTGVPHTQIVSSLTTSTDEVRSVNEQTGGEKGVKLARFDLVPAQAMVKVARHYGIGAVKYDDNNWRKGYEWSKSIAALERHLNAFKAGEDLDHDIPEGLPPTPHMAAIVFHALALLTYADEHPELDDRWTRQ